MKQVDAGDPPTRKKLSPPAGDSKTAESQVSIAPHSHWNPFHSIPFLSIPLPFVFAPRAIKYFTRLSIAQGLALLDKQTTKQLKSKQKLKSQQKSPAWAGGSPGEVILQLVWRGSKCSESH